MKAVVLDEPAARGRPIMEIPNSGPERRLFQSADEVREYLSGERDPLDR